MSQLLNFSAIQKAAIETQPFPYLILRNFIAADQLPSLQQDFPDVPGAGSYPVNILNCGPRFQTLLDELQGPELRKVIAEKFSIPLEDRPTLVTIRGHSDHSDGRIHADSKSKLITVLLYMNADWENSEGRLRLLRDPNDIESVITEISPEQGTLLIFKVSDNSWHGHKPFIGLRRVIQLNYVLDEHVVTKELARHRFSAKIKKLKQFLHLPTGSQEY